ncbi:SDR family NAD(P)-dependent oxidoreductase [Lichenibacterium dinghuense]|uniref:SDR family NAD(P)-dependent oxidoreductase n=1 Tax=Lichenibacterium dinghuense TaxID=2895977 RepID=UPI001F2D11B0|nr:SDR family NAD(P)-dependent oxidoreductase [Lichenibacterium sp. 6Y81]
MPGPSFTANLGGRVALVTGASGGLGAHFAALLARSGARVAVAARRAESCAAVCEALRAAGGEAEAFRLDVADAASVGAAFAAVEARFGALDVLVNNAGISAAGPSLDLPEEAWDRVVDTNLKGAFLCAQAAARIMRARGGGAIVNVASILGLRVAAQVAPYAASKAGLVQLTRALALEWARHGVRVNALCPGYVETDINRGFFASDAGQAMVKRIPQRRIGTAEDLDGPLLLLCSDASRYMTGAEIAVDGGHLVSSL